MPPPSQPRGTSNGSQRAAQRTEWTPESALSVSYMPRKGETIQVGWVDISVSGAKITLSEEFMDELPEGAPMRIRFAIAEEEFRVNGRVIWSHLDAQPGMISVGVTFAYMDPEIGNSHPELWEYFNRRKAYRVSPPIGTEVPVLLEGEAGSVETKMMDISATGISVQFSSENARETWIEKGLGHKYRLSLRLSATHMPMELMARAEREMSKAGKKCWGMSFLEEDERHLEDELERIAEYVFARQRQMRELTD